MSEGVDRIRQKILQVNFCGEGRDDADTQTERQTDREKTTDTHEERRKRRITSSMRGYKTRKVSGDLEAGFSNDRKDFL